MRKYTFNKSEKLCEQKAIDELFQKGKAFNEDELRVIHIENTKGESNINRLLISVSKKKIRKASKRNPIKRKIREAYRLNKYILIDALVECKLNVDFAIIYQAKDDIDYKKLESKIILSLQRLAKLYGEDNKGDISVVD